MRFVTTLLVLLCAAPLAACRHSLHCGVCPSGEACGSANGLAVCRAPSGIPTFQHVFVILMENTSLDTLQDNSAAPYLNGLFHTAAFSTNYHGVAHPSLPNYLALTSGSAQGVSCDCQPTGDACTSSTCNSLTGSCGCAQTADNLGDALESAGKSWRNYAEDMGAPCVLTASGNYAPKHVPFLYYNDIQQDAARCAAHVVDYATDFPPDLAGAMPSFAFISPNLIDDMHNPAPATNVNLTNGDTWLSKMVPPLLDSAAYRDGGVLFIVWDEDDLSGLLAPDDPIPMLVLSPYARSGGYLSFTHYDHYSLLATIEDGLGTPRLGASAQATPLTDFFPPE